MTTALQTFTNSASPVRTLARIAQRHPYATAAAATVGFLALSAFVNNRLAKKAERDNPPAGRFMTVQGVRLHYIERGQGKPLVMLHGNGSMVEDFVSSGLVDLAAKNHRVIVFDRPGFGHSDRPRDVVWTPDAQAHLIKLALDQMGISQATILGHSWGTSVAIALGLRYPQLVRGLILVSGYYYPTFRLDVIALSTPALPVIGDILSHTISPIMARMIWPAMMAKIFGPQAVPKKFGQFPKQMAVRPSQLRASAAETALMIPDAFHFRDRYHRLTMPIVIVAGEDDRLVSAEQSGQLCANTPHSQYRSIPGNGHMVHQTATDTVMSAVDEVFALQTPVPVIPKTNRDVTAAAA